MRKIAFLAIVVLLFVCVSVNAGTLNAGVHLGALHLAGGAPDGNPITAQLKYGMAIDSKVGIGNRYRPVYNTYHNDVYNSYSTTYATSYDTYRYEAGSTSTWVSVNADVTGNLSVTTNSWGNPIP